MQVEGEGERERDREGDSKRSLRSWVSANTWLFASLSYAI